MSAETRREQGGEGGGANKGLFCVSASRACCYCKQHALKNFEQDTNRRLRCRHPANEGEHCVKAVNKLEAQAVHEAQGAAKGSYNA